MREEALQGEVEGQVRTALAECGERLGEPWGRRDVGDLPHGLGAGETSLGGRVAEGFRADPSALGADPVDAGADEVAEAPVRRCVSP
ncbi:hypothetical protein [Streptomyces sp. bgisy034]|uniref:hypothetical protein n=1 Tax=Streptomyces sp. bgisy034 TaxID=3413774 RepID=UPI003EBDC462